MEIKLKPTSVIEARLGLEHGGEIHAFFTAECARQMDRFVPFDKGNLAETVIVGGQITENVTATTITYNQKYARYVYYGERNGKAITIHQDKHPDASAYWDKEMWTAKKEDIIQAVQDYIKTHGGK